MNKPVRLALLPALLPALVALAGCASPNGAYPSLAVRESERVVGVMAVPTAPSYAAPAADPAALADSERLLAQAQAAHQAFLKTAPTARSAVNAAQGSARDSDRWASAQVAIADLEASRAQLMIALADLDRLTIDAAVAGTQFSDLASKRDDIAQLSDSQTQLITSMLESLAR